MEEKLNRDQADFLDMAAHHLYTPLTPILVDVQLLEQRLEAGHDESTQRILHRMRRNAERLRGVVEEISNSSHLQRSLFAMRHDLCDLADVARQAVAVYQDDAKDHGVHLAVSTASVMPVRGDLAGLQHVAYQLVGNAIHFTPEGGHVEVKVDETAGRPTLHVRDTGIGLSDDQKDRVFVPFSQPNDPVHHEDRGIGLGLFVSRLIAEAHDGTLETTEAGTGAAFRFSLPPAEARAHAVHSRR